MDWLRSCYKTTMVFRAGDDPVPVQWRFAADGAVPFPFPHSFGSANWDDGECKAGDLGEQPGPRPWVNGKALAYPNSPASACVPALYWVNGFQPGDGPLPLDFNGWPECCAPPGYSYFNGVLVPDVLCAKFSAPGCFDGTDGYTILLKRLRNIGVWDGRDYTLGGYLGGTEVILRRTGTTADSWSLHYINFSLLDPGGAISSPPACVQLSPFGLRFDFPDMGTTFCHLPGTVEIGEDCSAVCSDDRYVSVSCGSCVTMPRKWSLAVSGVTDSSCSNCSVLNGTFTLVYDSGCLWVSDPSDDACGFGPSDWAFYFTGVGWELDAPRDEFRCFLSDASFDCLGTNVLALSYDSGACVPPGTVTLTPIL